MKIIDPGIVPGSAVYRNSCHQCKCRYEFEEREAQVSHDRDGKLITTACPQCKTTNYGGTRVQPEKPAGGIVKPRTFVVGAGDREHFIPSMQTVAGAPIVDGSISGDKISSVNLAGLVVEGGRIRLKRGAA